MHAAGADRGRRGLGGVRAGVKSESGPAARMWLLCTVKTPLRAQQEREGSGLRSVRSR